MENKWAEYAGELTPKYIANRFDNGKGDRFYHFMRDGERYAAAGITTWLQRVLPESPFLVNWKLKFGNRWEQVLNLTANYGTTMHTAIGHMMIHNEHPPQAIIDIAKSYLRELKAFDKNVSEDLIDKNIISFQKFREDYNLKPLLIEAVLICETDGSYYAMTQDLLAEIDNPIVTKTEVQDGFFVKGAKKNQPKFKTETTTVINKEIVCIDFKSNVLGSTEKGKSFYDSHLYQLIATAKAVHQNFDIRVDRIMNWSPNNWRTKIGDYTLHEWKPSKDDYDIFSLYEQLASKRGCFVPSGSISKYKPYKEGMKSNEMYQSFGYLDYINHEQDNEPKII